ncbi:integral er membrane protein [Sporothrix brasiliensis 5110]|uniref:Integral er membrane protein n=1 Tax=Sporothrix brasiliensis 5110 TaxID=1398154 RepID=A0A0C2IFT0_9PEZI|nr:integral er membrane protein [Sporothrix brasiliensis 5110]KIH88066.1 integral er membrane protein [Sporothrix brasiliensis 5110]
MSVEIEPAELGFRRPFTVEVSESLRIRNPNSTPVAFKVKTTAPKQYCVRPNSGRIEPDREVEVTVLLQAMKQDPPADYKCRDKFLVQAVPITGDKEFISVQDIWDRVEKADVQERKIRVAFLAAEDPDAVAPTITPARQTATNGFDFTPDVPPPSYVSPREEPTLNGVLSPEAAWSDRKSVPNVASPATSQAASPSPAAHGTTSPAAAQITTTTANDKDATIAALTAKLAEAEALISSLRKDGGLRQRKGAAGSTGVSEKSGDADSTATGDVPTAQLQQQVRQGTEGVPLQVTAILVLLSFLLAYFFF